MGWKTLKEMYRIEHIVQVTDSGICIGTGYIHDLMIVSTAGVLVKRNDHGCNVDLVRYQREMEADPAALAAAVAAVDTFGPTSTVYTYDGGKIVEHQCEMVGWPNVTVEGHVQFENTFSDDKSKVVRWAKKSAASAFRYESEHLERLRKDVAETTARVEQCRKELAQLDVDYPVLPEAPAVFVAALTDIHARLDNLAATGIFRAAPPPFEGNGAVTVYDVSGLNKDELALLAPAILQFPNTPDTPDSEPT